MRRTPAVPPGVRIPATPVVGYVRADDPGVVECLRGLLEDYAGGAGLLVVDMFTESPDATGAARPAFTRCIEAINGKTVRGIVVPTWAHLAPDGVPGAALLRAAREAGALLFVADQSFTPWWAVGEAAGAPPVHADQQAAAPGPAQRGDLQ